MTLTFELRLIDRLRHAVYVREHVPEQRQAVADQRWFVAWWGLLGGVLAAAAAHSWAGVVTAGAFALGSYTLYGRWARWSHLRSARRRLAEPEFQHTLGTYTLELLAEGIRYHSAAIDVRVPWASLREVTTTSDYTFINIGAGAGLPIPRQTVRAGDYEAVSQALRRQSAAASGA